MRQILCALLLLGLTACTDNAQQQAQTGQPTATKAPADSGQTARPTAQYTPLAVTLADIPAKLRLPGQLQEA